MGNMEQIKKERITGYRKPTQWERSKIQNYMLSELRNTKRRIFTGTILCGLVALSLIVTVITEFSSASLGMSVVWTTLAMIFTLSFLVLLKRKRWNYILTENIRTGSFEVMDCKAYETDLSGDMIGGIVKIYNAKGQYCQDSFAMDMESIKECRKNPSLDFLLMRTTCGVEKEDIYELFTERKLERR